MTADILPSSSCPFGRALMSVKEGHAHRGGDLLTGAVLLGTMLLSLGWSYWLNCLLPKFIRSISNPGTSEYDCIGDGVFKGVIKVK